MDVNEPTSIRLPRDHTPMQRLLAWEWCRARWGEPCSHHNPTGAWAWSDIPGVGTVITLPDQGSAVEMRLVEPWNV
jgi:hypothetical protein